MKKMSLVISLFFLSSGVIYFAWISSAQQAGDRPLAIKDAQEEINNQINRAKARLYGLASAYINQIEHFNNEITHRHRIAKARERFCPAIAGLEENHCHSPTKNLDPIPYIGDIQNASAQMVVGLSQFQVDVSKIRYQACNEVGYLCLSQKNLSKKDTHSFQALWDGLPITEFDQTILQAINLLQNTSAIIEKILANYR